MADRKQARDNELMRSRLPQKTTLPGPESPGPDIEKEWITEKRDLNKNNIQNQMAANARHSERRNK